MESPSPSAGDLSELPRVPLRGEGSCGGGGAKITADGDCSHEIKRRLLLGRKVIHQEMDSVSLLLEYDSLCDGL